MPRSRSPRRADADPARALGLARAGDDQHLPRRVIGRRQALADQIRGGGPEDHHHDDGNRPLPSELAELLWLHALTGISPPKPYLTLPGDPR